MKMQANKPMYTASIAQVQSNQTIPATLLRKLAEENQSAFGLCVREPDKMIVEKFHKLDGLEKQNAFLDKLMDSTKKYECMFCFHAFPTEFDEDETMPWTVLKDSKGAPLLVVAIDGDFPKHTDNEFSEAYVLMNDWLGPKIEDMYKVVGNSPQKLFEYLKSSQFANDFAQTLGHRGSLSFMPSVGPPFVVEKNDIGLVSPEWGSVTNAYGYTESAIAAATPAADKPATPAAKASRYVDDALPATPPKPEVIPPAADPKPVTDPGEKVAADLQPEEIDWTPPQGVHGKPLKAAYRAVNNNVLPDNWRDRPTIRIRTKKSVKDFKEMPSLTGAKDMKIEPAKVDSKILTMPIISGQQQEKAVDFIKKYVGDGSAVIDDPIESQKQELKLAKFSSLVLKSGKLDEILRWKTEFVFAFVKDNPETSALAIIEMRNELRKVWAAIKSGDKTLAELVGTEQVVEKPAPEAQPQPDVVKEPVKRGASKYA